jgi:hypothetical protein
VPAPDDYGDGEISGMILLLLLLLLIIYLQMGFYPVAVVLH